MRAKAADYELVLVKNRRGAENAEKERRRSNNFTNDLF
jgi:hypothetical protein